MARAATPTKSNGGRVLRREAAASTSHSDLNSEVTRLPSITEDVRRPAS